MESKRLPATRDTRPQATLLSSGRPFYCLSSFVNFFIYFFLFDRDTGNYGFQLPPNQIIPQGQEVVPAVKYFLLSLLDSPIKNS